MALNEIVTDEQVIKAFKNTNFGDSEPRDIIRYTLLKSVCGYHSGHTATVICQEVGLLTNKNSLTKKGKEYLYESFRNGTNH